MKTKNYKVVNMLKNRVKIISKLTTILFIFVAFFISTGNVQAGTTNLYACGNLSTANETYILQNDVTSNGTCFGFSASGIVLDLNGYTVKYADLDFTGILNPGLEEENPNNPLDAIGWDLSGAHGNAFRQDYTQQLFF